MKNSLLFNISEQEGLPGGPNEMNHNILGSLSVTQHVFVPENNMQMSDNNIYETGGVIKQHGWEYKKEGDQYLTRRAGIVTGKHVLSNW